MKCRLQLRARVVVDSNDRAVSVAELRRVLEAAGYAPSIDVKPFQQGEDR